MLRWSYHVNTWQARQTTSEVIMLSTDTICPYKPYGQHIRLKCKNHKHLNWSTKNITAIGCRSIFFSGSTAPKEHPDAPELECNCSGRLLYHDCTEFNCANHEGALKETD